MKKGTEVVTDRKLPHGFSIRYVSGRTQPFTVWRGEETVYFAATEREAVDEAWKIIQ